MMPDFKNELSQAKAPSTILFLVKIVFYAFLAFLFSIFFFFFQEILQPSLTQSECCELCADVIYDFRQFYFSIGAGISSWAFLSLRSRNEQGWVLSFLSAYFWSFMGFTIYVVRMAEYVYSFSECSSMYSYYKFLALFGGWPFAYLMGGLGLIGEAASFAFFSAIFLLFYKRALVDQFYLLSPRSNLKKDTYQNYDGYYG